MKDRFETVGRAIGSGTTRRVYQSKHYPDRVVKIIHVGGHSCNRREFKQWKAASRALRKHMARVYGISEDGRKLLMQKTSEVSVPELLKHKIPAALNMDAHSGNFGRIGSRIVMHDFAFHRIQRTSNGRFVRPGFL